MTTWLTKSVILALPQQRYAIGMSQRLSAQRFYVSGRVQGVFFRASAKRVADRLGLRGWAINLPDGRVEVVAVGLPESLAEMADWLHDGPIAAKVLGVESAPADIAETEDCQGFATG